MVENMDKFKSYATKGAGKKHAPACQDACFYDSKLSLVVVADGLGSQNCFRSSKGSQIAVECASEGICEFLSHHDKIYIQALLKEQNGNWELVEKEFDKKIHTLINHIITQWNIKVEADFADNPFTEEELNLADEKHRGQYASKDKKSKAYATTLIACAITDNYLFGMHIGDGRFSVLYEDASFAQPVPWDDRCFLNNTTTICDQDAHERARFLFSTHRNPLNKNKKPVAIFICTDGIDDNYPVEQNEEHLYKLYKTISLTFAEAGFESTCKQLDGLVNKFATEGKADDTSIGVLIDMEGLKKVVNIWKAPIRDEESIKSSSQDDNKPVKIEDEKIVEEKTESKVIADKNKVLPSSKNVNGIDVPIKRNNDEM